MTSKRLFVALPLPEPVKMNIHAWIERYRPDLPFQKWVHRDDLHLTLKFLGETDEKNIEQVRTHLMIATKNIQPFPLIVEGLGTFGRPAAPSVLWAGIKGDQAALLRLQQSIETSLERLGYEREQRPFHPHITFARRYTGELKMNREAFSRLAEQSDLKGLSLQVDHIMLYESKLGGQPMYREVFQAPLESP